MPALFFLGQRYNLSTMLVVVVSVLFISLIPTVVTLESKCFLSDGQCTYNVQLSKAPGPCNKGAKDIDYNVQNDATRDDHEERLRQLEKNMQELLLATLAYLPAREETPRFNPGGKYSIDNTRAEDRLLSSLHAEFRSVREKLRIKTQILQETDKKLNETLKALAQTQQTFVQTNRDLVSAEDKVGFLQEENFNLRTSLTEKKEKLKVTTERLNKTDTILQELQVVYNETSTSEDTLKVELSDHKEVLNETTVLLEKTSKDYKALVETHTETAVLLKRRERELIQCYTAKTETFCGFEDPNICGFTQENGTDSFNWKRVRGKTPSSNTGPDYDHTCGGTNGHFMYIEASSRSQGQNAVLYSPKYRGLSEQCLEFFYHMYGRNVGTLNVYTKAFGDEVSSVWQAVGNQGNYWIVSRLYIPEEMARAGYQIGFEAVTALGFQGDIAIDDVRVKDGACSSDEYVRPVVVKVTHPTSDPKPETTIASKHHGRRGERKRKRRLRKLRQRIAVSLNTTAETP